MIKRRMLFPIGLLEYDRQQLLREWPLTSAFLSGYLFDGIFFFSSKVPSAPYIGGLLACVCLFLPLNADCISMY